MSSSRTKLWDLRHPRRWSVSARLRQGSVSLCSRIGPRPSDASPCCIVLYERSPVSKRLESMSLATPQMAGRLSPALH
jgi:hypothetical protein